MKRYLPFVFPAAAVLVVVFLTYRWYSHNTTGVGQISEFAEGVEIEELTDDEQINVNRGVGDISTVQLQPVMQTSQEGEADSEDDTNDMTSTASGQVRYETVDGKVRFSIMAALPEPEMGQYQVWLKAVDSDAIRKAFTLEMGKGGYMGSAAISANTLPFEVLVSLESGESTIPSNILLRGVVQAETEEPQE